MSYKWTPDLVRLADVQPEAVNWLWPPYIPRGKVTIAQGDGGLGKSWLSLALAAEISRGTTHLLPGHPDARKPAESVVILSAEDDPADTIRPRLDGLQAASEHIYALRSKSTTSDDGERVEASITLADIAVLCEVVEKVRPSLVVIDPLAAYLGAKTDMHRSNEVRPLLAALADLAATYDLAVLIIHHHNKNTGARAMQRGAGSYDIQAAARSVLTIAEDPDDPQRRIIAHSKSNLAAPGSSLVYTLAGGSFQWDGTSNLTADQLLAQPASEGERSALADATDWLESELSSGPVPAGDLKRSAAQAGLSWTTVERAKSALDIKPRRASHGNEGRGLWLWELPTEDTHAPTTSVDGLAALPERPMNTALSQGSQDETLTVLPEPRLGRDKPARPQGRQVTLYAREDQPQAMTDYLAAHSNREPSPIERELEQIITKDSNLDRRAADLYAQLASETAEQLAARIAEKWPSANAQDWWLNKAKSEPLAVAIAVELRTQDGAKASAAHHYLAAGNRAASEARK